MHHSPVSVPQSRRAHRDVSAEAGKNHRRRGIFKRFWRNQPHRRTDLANKRSLHQLRGSPPIVMGAQSPSGIYPAINLLYPASDVGPMCRQACLLFGRSFREQFNSGQSLAKFDQGLLRHLDSNGSPLPGADQNTFTIGSCRRFVCQKR